MSKEYRFNGSALGPTGEKFLEFARKRVKGQDGALRSLAKALDQADSPLRDKSKPIYSVLLVGGAGSGKTHLAKVVAEFLFGDPGAISVIPCSQFFRSSYNQNTLDRHAWNFHYQNNQDFRNYAELAGQRQDCIEKLKSLGQVLESKSKKKKETAAKEQAKLMAELLKINKQLRDLSSLVASVFQNLQSVVVFDHIEEGAGEVLSVLRSVLEFGALTISSEEGSSRVSFANSIVFITCNDFVPQDENAPGVKKFLGFEAKTDKGRVERSNNDRRRYLRGMEELKEHFPGKFLSRIDRVEILKEYSPEARLEIVSLLESELTEILSRGFPIVLVIDKEVKEFIVREGSDHPELGIRLLKKKFNKHIRTNLGLLISRGLVKPNDAFRVSLVKKENDEYIQFSKMDIPNLPSNK